MADDRPNRSDEEIGREDEDMMGQDVDDFEDVDDIDEEDEAITGMEDE
jgi:hypothetical protein